MSLISSLDSGISALDAFNTGLQVIGNNIANINTTAFKASNTSYANSFSDTLLAASPGSDTGAMQVGTGVQVAGVNTDFTQGSLAQTGVTTNLAVSGNGYFVVQNSATSTNYATRDGTFTLDSTGNLVNAQGYKVLDSTGTGTPISITNCVSAAGTAMTYANMSSITIGPDGTVTTYDSAGTAYTGQKVGLLSVPSQSKLMTQGNNLYDFSATGATLSANLGAANTSSLGSIQSGELEQSNVDLTAQFGDMITAQRSFEAASRVITVSDGILNTIVNMKNQ
jgi:flagellar hook protein FlgE